MQVISPSLIIHLLLSLFVALEPHLHLSILTSHELHLFSSIIELLEIVVPYTAIQKPFQLSQWYHLP